MAIQPRARPMRWREVTGGSVMEAGEAEPAVEAMLVAEWPQIRVEQV